MKPCKIKFLLLNPFSSSLFNLVWRFTKSLSNFWKAMLNTTSKFFETFPHGLVGARQEWYHTCLFTFHDPLSLLLSLLLTCLPIFLASTTENVSSPLFPIAWPWSKPRFITRGEKRRGETLIFTLCFPLPTLSSQKSLLLLLGHCHHTAKACHWLRGSSLSKCLLSFLGRCNTEMWQSLPCQKNGYV